MYRPFMVTAISLAMTVTAANAYALQRGQGHGPKPKTNGPSAPKGPKVQSGPKAQAQGPKAAGPKATGPKATGPKATAAKAPKSKAAGPKVTSAKTDKGPKRTTATGGTTTLTAVQQKLQRNTNLAAKLRGRLPAGTDLMTAADGFRNLGQFVAAVNVSNNLGISFTELKTRMVDDGMSLGQAIKAARADVDGTTLARRAEADATRLIGDTTTTEESKAAKTKKSTKPAKTKKSRG